MIVAPTASTGNTTVVTGIYIRQPYTIIWRTPHWSSLGISAPTSKLIYQFTFQGCSGVLSDSNCSGSVVNTFVMGLSWQSGQPQSFYFTLLDWYVGAGNTVSVTVDTKDDDVAHVYKADFNGTFLTITLDNNVKVQTNLFKNPLPIFNITLNATLGGQAYVNNRAVSYIDIVTGIDWASLVGTIMPIAIAIAVVVSVLTVLRKVAVPAR